MKWVIDENGINVIEEKMRVIVSKFYQEKNRIQINILEIDITTQVQFHNSVNLLYSSFIL